MHDLDTNVHYLITNKGDKPVKTNDMGQVPARFTAGVTGVSGYEVRRRLGQKYEANNPSLAIACETPKSLQRPALAQKKFYTPASAKMFGYAQCPNQTVMPY